MEALVPLELLGEIVDLQLVDRLLRVHVYVALAFVHFHVHDPAVQVQPPVRLRFGVARQAALDEGGLVTAGQEAVAIPEELDVLAGDVFEARDGAVAFHVGEVHALHEDSFIAVDDHFVRVVHEYVVDGASAIDDPDLFLFLDVPDIDVFVVVGAAGEVLAKAHERSHQLWMRLQLNDY